MFCIYNNIFFSFNQVRKKKEKEELLPNSSILFCKGLRLVSISFISWKVFPNSVSRAVDITTTVAFPIHFIFNLICEIIDHMLLDRHMLVSPDYLNMLSFP